jgi:ATP-dependent exoDNAse (exonuclease V) beta subunit
MDEGDTPSGRAVGLVVHALLERHALDAECPEADLLRGEAADLSQTAADVRLSRADLERAVDLTRAFWHSPIARDRALPDATRETPFVFTVGETMVSGVMDLVWQEAGVWHIVDYKTNALGGRAPAEAAAGYELQGALYALAALRAGAGAVSMDFLFLERPDAPVTRSFARADEPRLESMLERELDLMRHGRFPAQPGEDCARCPVAALCAGMAGSIGHGIQ